MINHLKLRPSVSYIKHKYQEQSEKTVYRSSILVSGEKQQASKRYADLRSAVKSQLKREKVEWVMSMLALSVMGFAAMFIIYYGFFSNIGRL